MASPPSQDEPLWYFAYGSNLDADRFRARVGDYAERRRARLHDHRLRFSGDVQSEGGGGAIVLPSPGDVVHGAVFRITQQQMESMDREEFHPSRNTDGRGVRIRRTVTTDGGELDAEVYTLKEAGSFRAPSRAYLEHILKGLADAGYPDEVLDGLRSVAAAEPFA